MKQIKRMNQQWAMKSILLLAGLGFSMPAQAGPMQFQPHVNIPVTRHAAPVQWPPDLQVSVSLEQSSVRKSNPRCAQGCAWNYTIRGSVKNVGRGAFVPLSNNAQTLNLYGPGVTNTSRSQLIQSWPFGRLNPGQEKRVSVHVQRQPGPSVEFVADYKMNIVFGPDSLGDPNRRNNQASLRRSTVVNAINHRVTIRPVGAPVSTMPSLPDLTIVRVTPRLIPQAARACQSGRPYNGGLIHLETTVKNIGRGRADYSRYQYGIRITTTDPLSARVPGFFTRKIYATGSRSGAPGQSVTNQNDLDASGAYSGSFPPERYHELAGTTRHFKVEIIDGPGTFPHPILESNYHNNAKTFSFTFPRNFCQSNVLHEGISQTVPTLKPHLVIQSIRAQLRRPYECRTDGPTFADGDLVLKNTGADFMPGPGGDVFNVNGGLSVGHNQLNLRSVGYLRSRIPAGATRHVRFAMTGTAGVLHMPTPPMSSLAGRTVPITLSFFELAHVVSGNRNSSIRFPAAFCGKR